MSKPLKASGGPVGGTKGGVPLAFAAASAATPSASFCNSSALFNRASAAAFLSGLGGACAACSALLGDDPSPVDGVCKTGLSTTTGGGTTTSSGGVLTTTGGGSTTTSFGGTTTSSGGGTSSTTTGGGTTTSSGGVSTTTGGGSLPDITTSSGGVSTTTGGGSLPDITTSSSVGLFLFIFFSNSLNTGSKLAFFVFSSSILLFIFSTFSSNFLLIVLSFSSVSGLDFVSFILPSTLSIKLAKYSKISFWLSFDSSFGSSNSINSVIADTKLSTLNFPLPSDSELSISVFLLVIVLYSL